MANTENETTPATAGVNGGLEAVQRLADNERSARESRAGEALAKKLGISIEELDRRLQSAYKQRDSAGQPALAITQLAERAAIDDFGPNPSSPSKRPHDTPNKEAARVGEAMQGKESSADHPREGKTRESDHAAEELRLIQEQHKHDITQRVEKQYDKTTKALGETQGSRSDKAKVVEAVASATVNATVRHAAVREKVMLEVNRQLDHREGTGRVPTVQVYDVTAPAKPRENAPVQQRERQKMR